MREGDEHHVPAALSPTRALVHTGGGWMGPNAGLDGFRCRQSLLPPPWIESRMVKHVASRVTDYTNPASVEYTYRPTAQSSWEPLHTLSHNEITTVPWTQHVMHKKASYKNKWYCLAWKHGFLAKVFQHSVATSQKTLRLSTIKPIS
jgi:hypothetical protein